MEFWVERLGGVLHPADQESVEEFAKLPTGKAVRAKIERPRNPSFHRLYFALCARIANAKGVPTENISDVLKIATGHVTILKTRSYGEVHVPKSISFAAMDDLAFRDFFERCVQTIYQEWQIEPEMVSDLLVPQEAGRG